MSVKPVLKWVGGKQRIANQILDRVPSLEGTYWEPFAGGLSVFLGLNPERSYVNDKGRELMNFYEQFALDHKAVIDMFEMLGTDESVYYKIRNIDRNNQFEFSSPLFRAARFLYINKRGFNGLWRVNTKIGYCTTPFGHGISKPRIDPANAAIFAERLRNTTLYSLDYELFLQGASKGDFVYLDPPYVPINDTSSFVAYTQGGFPHAEHLRLKDVCDNLSIRGVNFLMSNSESAVTRELYKTYTIEAIEATRTVSGSKKSSGRIGEVLIRNYVLESDE